MLDDYPRWVAVMMAAWWAVVGLALGSFLNVVIARVPAGLSVVSPRSRCPRCGHELSWYENIPVFSWILLRARCRGCKLPISARYPLVESLTALLFLAALVRFGWSRELGAATLLILFLVPLTFIDLDTWLLPDELTYPGIAAGIAVSALGGWPSLRNALLGAALGYFGFWALEWLGAKIFQKEALGAGDKNLLALIGAFTGPVPLLGVVFLASLQGAIVGSLLLLIKGRAGPAPIEEPAMTQPLEGPPAETPATANAAPDTPPAPMPAAEEPAPVPAVSDRPADLPDPPGESAEADPGPDEDDWVPGPTNMPFGPWLSIAALEVVLVGPWLASKLPPVIALLVGGR